MCSIVRGKKVPGAAGEEGRKDRQEDAYLIPYLIKKQLETSRGRLREEVAEGDLDRPPREARGAEMRRTEARGPDIAVDSGDESWRRT